MKGSNKPIVIAMTLWICLLATFLSWLEMDSRSEEKRLARSTAYAFFQQVVVSRLWNASHGGVYVPITPNTPPNPYLPLANRDLTADNGLRLTRINPSYMTRQIAELAQRDKDGIQFHITSLQPIRPENRPTPWEEEWLRSFEQGAKEQSAFITEGQMTWFRYMAPLLTTSECLGCHGAQGYREGDIRGGLSVSLPYRPHTHLSMVVAYGSVAVIGLLAIFIAGILHEKKRLLFDAIFDNTIPTCVTGTNHTILMANDSYWREFGPLADPKKPIKCYEHRPGSSCHGENCPITHILQGESKYVCESCKEKNSAAQDFIVTAKPLLDSRGRVTAIVESFQEITQRKQAEKALAESNLKLEALSSTDGLTGIANRRHFDRVLAQEHARHARSGANLSLILLDIDHFKAFNDNYGHVQGDECLRRIAQVLQQCAGRPADLAARYGGEEFACILPETDRIGAIAIAEKIRQGIIDQAIPHHHSSAAEHVTASIGVVTVQSRAVDSAVEIVDQVDKLLYRAKSSGRNRVEFVAAPPTGEITGNFVQLVWQDSFSCGNPLIDGQHFALFQTANELLAAILSTPPAAEISALIGRLLDEVSQHFHDEEIILKRVDFPGMGQHVAEHAKLLAKGRELSAKFANGTLEVGTVFTFLAHEVVMLHILKADREYVPFITKSGTDSTP